MHAADDKDILVFPRRTKLPTEEKSISLYIATDRQKKISFQISQGQRIDFSENFFIGDILVENLPLAFAGQAGARCKIRINENGILLIEAGVIGVDGMFSKGEFSMNNDGQNEQYSQDQILESRKFVKRRNSNVDKEKNSGNFFKIFRKFDT